MSGGPATTASAVPAAGAPGDTATSQACAAGQPADGASHPTLASAVHLTERVKEACNSAEFQEQLERLYQKGGIAKTMGLAQLLGRACKIAGEQAGIDGAFNVPHLKLHVQRHGTDPILAAMAADVERLLRLPSGSIFGSVTAGPRAPAPAAAAEARPAPRDSLPRLLQALAAECGTPEFCSDLDQLSNLGGVHHQLGLALLINRALKAVAGGSDGSYDVQRLKEAVRSSSSRAVHAGAAALERRLGLQVGDIFPPAERAPEAKEEAAAHVGQEVEMQPEALANELRKACSSERFQEEVTKLRRAGGITYQVGLANLMGRTCRSVTKALGWGEWDLQRVKAFLRTAREETFVRTTVTQIEELAGLTPGAILGAAVEAAPQAAAVPDPPAERTPVLAGSARGEEEGEEMVASQAARDLLGAMAETCRLPDFQSSISQLQQRGGITFQLGLAKLTSQVCRAATEAAKLGPEWTLQRIKGLAREHRDDPEVQALAREVESLLQVDTGAIFGITSETAEPEEGKGLKPADPVVTAATGGFDGQPPEEQARLLMQALRSACSQEDLQSMLSKFQASGGIAFQFGLAQLMGRACSTVASELALPGDRWSMPRIKDFVKQYGGDLRIRQLSREVEALLRLEPGSIFGMSEAKDPVETAPRAPEPILIKFGENGVPLLTLDQALRLQDDLYEGFVDEDFQSQLQDLRLKWRSGTTEFLRERQQLCLMVQRVVLPRYGFEGTLKGIYDMMGVLRQFAWSEDFNCKGAAIDELLGLRHAGSPAEAQEEEPPSCAAAPQGAEMIFNVEEMAELVIAEGEWAGTWVRCRVGGRAAATGTYSVQVLPGKDYPGWEEASVAQERLRKCAPPKEVRITVKHAITEEEARLVVLSDANMREVREALAAALQRPELAKQGRLVRRVASSGFASFRDDEKLGSRRTLLIIGVENLLEEMRKPELESPAKQVKTPDLGEETAAALQRELIAGFRDVNFQARLQELYYTTSRTRNERTFNAERQKLFLSVQSEVLPKFGFPGTLSGVFEMMQQFSKFTGNQEIEENGLELDRLLNRQDEDSPTVVPLEACATHTGSKVAGEVIVTVTHAVTGEVAEVSVPAEARLGEVREALAAILKRADIARCGRWVRKLNKSAACFAAIRDSEPLKGRRSLLLLGVDFLSDESAGAGISLEKALSIQRDLILHFEKPAFQKKLNQLRGELQVTNFKKFNFERLKLYSSVHSIVLPRHGLPGDTAGVMQMMEGMSAHSGWDLAFDRNAARLNELLGIDEQGRPLDPPPQLLGDLPAGLPPPRDAPNPQVPLDVADSLEPEPEEVEVTVKNAMEPSEKVRVRVLATSSMRDVKLAVAGKLERDDIAAKCRLVRKLGGGFASFQDSESLGSRRTLLLMGVESLKAGKKVSEASEPAKVEEPLHTGHREERRARAPALSKEAALSLQRDLYEAFAAEGFQESLQAIRGMYRSGTADFTLARIELITSAQAPILPRYGFEGSQMGALSMKRALDRFSEDDEEIRELGAKIHEVLGLGEVALEEWFNVGEQAEYLMTTTGSWVSCEVVSWDEHSDRYVVWIPRQPPQVETELDLPGVRLQQLRRLSPGKDGEAKCVDKAECVDAASDEACHFTMDTPWTGVADELAGVAAETAAEPLSQFVPQQQSERRLGLADALQLQEDLIAGFQDPHFQKRLRDIRASFPPSSPELERERRKLFFTVQSFVLPKYGFDGTSRGIIQMVEAMKDFYEAAEFQLNGDRLNRVLGIVEGLEEQPQDGEVPLDEGTEDEEEVCEVSVTIRHAVREDEAELRVLSTATVQEVRAALAEKLGRPDILQDARLVRRVGGELTPFQDTDRLRGRRGLLLVGVWDLQPAGTAQPPKWPESPGGGDKEEEEEMVQVLVRHGLTDEELSVTVPSTASMRRVKAALSTELGRPEILREGRIVRRSSKLLGHSGKSLASFRDSDLIGVRRHLLLMGVQDLHPGPLAVSSGMPLRKQKHGLTLQQALDLQRDLLEGFGTEPFQSELRALREAHKQTSKHFRSERQRLFLAVQSQVLPSYGFEGTQRGVFEMLEAFEAFHDSEEFRENGAELDRMLGLAEAGQEPAAVAAEVVEVTVTVMNAIGMSVLEVLQVDIPSDATMRRLREEVTQKLPWPSVLRTGRFVEETRSGLFVAHPDSEQLKGRCAFLLLFTGTGMSESPSAVPAV